MISIDWRGPHVVVWSLPFFHTGVPWMNPIAWDGFSVQPRPIMESTGEQPEGQGLRYWWPPVVWIVSLVAGCATASFSRKAFMNTHGYFEIAALVALMAAIIYAIRLRPFRKDRRFRIPFFANLGIVILVVASVLLPWAGMSLE